MKTYPLAYHNQQHQLKLQPKLKQLQQHGKNGRVQQYQQHKEMQQKEHKVGSEEETDVALVVGRAAWWMPVLAANNNMRNLTFAEAFRDFLQNVSFHCYGKLVERGRRYQERDVPRLFWLVFHAAALSTLIIFIWYNRNTEGQLSNTTLYDPLYPIRKVPFPAVSVCSINRISNASATHYAEELNKKDPHQRGVNFFYEQIKMLQYNYYVPDEIHDYYKALSFQRFLDNFDLEDTELFYDTRKRMAMLTPRCSDILLQCQLGGRVINCADEFEEKFTSKGLCCTFNSNNKYSTIRSSQRQFFSQQNMGLIVLLSAPEKDNFYKMFTLDGFIISIHSPSLHPDYSSGGVEESFALTGIETSFGITARVYETVSETRSISPKVRNCLFSDEVPNLYGDDYSFNNCITLCRIRSIRILCGCILFQTSYENVNPVDAVFCSLQHKECLMRYDFKWFNVITQRENIRGLGREMEDSLYCPECLPSCSETRYSMQVMGLPLNGYNMKSFPDYQQNYSDLALVNIFFGDNTALYYKRVLVNSWFEILSYLGSICGLIAGVSLIGICEVIFFFIKQLVIACKNEMLWDGKRRVTADQTLKILP